MSRPCQDGELRDETLFGRGSSGWSEIESRGWWWDHGRIESVRLEDQDKTRNYNARVRELGTSSQTRKLWYHQVLSNFDVEYLSMSSFLQTFKKILLTPFFGE